MVLTPQLIVSPNEPAAATESTAGKSPTMIFLSTTALGKLRVQVAAFTPKLKLEADMLQVPSAGSTVDPYLSLPLTSVSAAMLYWPGFMLAEGE
ncbi:hypothetical protein TO66_15710 [Pseudomonas sp. MRSN 12121]|nr:hypothetical protein TO66_15710 [Pseudomonas sp. MRSN 12121]